MKAYHFLRADYRTGYSEEPPWQVGEEREWEGEAVLCQSGYHSSPSWYNALLYAPGLVACLVEISEPVEKNTSKQVSRRRRLVAAADATPPVLLWLTDCCERALSHDLQADATSRAVPDAVRGYVSGCVTDEEMALVYSAAATTAEVARTTYVATTYNTNAVFAATGQTYHTAKAAACTAAAAAAIVEEEQYDTTDIRTAAAWAAEVATEAARAAKATEAAAWAACTAADKGYRTAWAVEITANTAAEAAREAKATEVAWQRQALTERLDTLF